MATCANAAEVDFNFGWNFTPEGWEGGSRKVDLPHDFQLEMPWREDAAVDRGFKPMGAARYRNAFVTDAAYTMGSDPMVTVRETPPFRPTSPETAIDNES